MGPRRDPNVMDVDRETGETENATTVGSLATWPGIVGIEKKQE